MPLQAYCLRKTIMLSPMATVREAARQMARHRIGAVLVGEQGTVTGIVTDRDLALFVVGDAADCKRTTLEHVMSDAVVAVDVTASISDVVAAMHARACRRIPIADRGMVIGVVSLDDLIADGRITLADAASVVKAVLDLSTAFGGREVGPEVLENEPRAPLRRERRAEQTLLCMIDAVRRRTGLVTRPRAATGLRIVLGAVHQALSRVDAEHFLAQMPVYVRRLLESDFPRRGETVNWGLLIGRTAAELALDMDHAERVLSGIAEVVSEGFARGDDVSLRTRIPAELDRIVPRAVGIPGKSLTA